MYHFYLNDELLPLAPARIRNRVNNRNQVVELVNSGDYNVLKDIGLTDFDFEVLLPGKPYPFIATVDNFHLPYYYLEKLHAYKVEKEPVRLIITRAMQTGADIFTTNLLVGIEDYHAEEVAGQEGDMTVSLRLREHRPPVAKTVQIIRTTQGISEAVQEVQRPHKPPERAHTVVRGDNLWAIATLKLNNGQRFGEIAELNGISQPWVIHPGQVLRLPPI